MFKIPKAKASKSNKSTKLRKTKISSPPLAVILLHVLILVPGGQEKQAHTCTDMTDGGYLCHVASPRWRPKREIIWPREVTGLECVLLSSNAITAWSVMDENEFALNKK